MDKINLKSKTRDIVGKSLKSYRKKDLIPAVIYGHKKESKSLWVDSMEFNNIYKKAGESTIIEIDIDGKSKASVLIHDTQKDPLTDKFSHIDFFQIKMDEKIETEVPLEFIGESPAVKEHGGVLVKTIDAVSVKCLPADLPSKIEVTISSLENFDNQIKISDLKVSDKVQIMADEKTIVASVTPPRTDEELAQLDEKVEEDVSKVEGAEQEEEEAVEGAEEGEAKPTEEKSK